MARSYVTKAQVSAAITAGTTVATSEETITDRFRNVPKRGGTMAAAITYLKTNLGMSWVSRNRLRAMALRLVREGVTFS